MNESRTLNAKRNIIWSFINKAVSLLLPFLTRTAIIYILGSLYLGLNSLFSSILNILSLAELGFGSAMVFSMYAPIADGRTSEVCALLRLYRKIYHIIGIIILGCGLLCLPFLKRLISGEVPNDINIYVLYLIYLSGTVLSYFLFAYKESILTASQRTDIVSNINSVTSILSSVAQLSMLLIFKNYYAYAVVTIFFTVVRNFSTSYIVDKRFPQYKCQGEIESGVLKDIEKRVAGLFIYKVCYAFRDSFDSIVISSFLGLAILAKYNNYYYIVTALTGIITVIKTSISAGVGNSIASESEEKNYHDFEKCQLLYMWLSGWCTVCLLCLFQPFIKLWIGEEYLFDSGIMILFCIYFFCYKMGDICAVYRQSAGLWWQDRFRPVVEAVVNLTLNIYLVRHIGVAGVMLSTIFCLIFINSIWASHVLYKNYFCHQKQYIYLLKISYYALITIIACVITGFICSRIPLDGIFAIIVRGGICIVIPNVLMLLGYMRLPEFKPAMKLIKNLFAARS